VLCNREWLQLVALSISLVASHTLLAILLEVSWLSLSVVGSDFIYVNRETAQLHQYIEIHGVQKNAHTLFFLITQTKMK